jgi:hypothetical protein
MIPASQRPGIRNCFHAFTRATKRRVRDTLGEFAGGFFEEFVDEGLVGFGLLGGPAAELAEERHVSHLRRWEIYIIRTQRLRAGLTSGAPTALRRQMKRKRPSSR